MCSGTGRNTEGIQCILNGYQQTVSVTNTKLLAPIYRHISKQNSTVTHSFNSYTNRQSSSILTVLPHVILLPLAHVVALDDPSLEGNCKRTASKYLHFFPKKTVHTHAVQNCRQASITSDNILTIFSSVLSQHVAPWYHNTLTKRPLRVVRQVALHRLVRRRAHVCHCSVSVA